MFDGSGNPDGDVKFAAGIRAPYMLRTSVSGTTKASVRLAMTRGFVAQVDCYIPLNGSLSGIEIDRKSQGIKIESSSCAVRLVDSDSEMPILNGKSCGAVALTADRRCMP